MADDRIKDIIAKIKKKMPGAREEGIDEDLVENALADVEYITGKPFTQPLDVSIGPTGGAYGSYNSDTRKIKVNPALHSNAWNQPERDRSITNTLSHEVLHQLGKDHEGSPWPEELRKEPLIPREDRNNTGSSITTYKEDRARHPAIADLLGRLSKSNLSQSQKKDYVDALITEMTKENYAVPEDGTTSRADQLSERYKTLGEFVGMMSPDEVKNRREKLKASRRDRQEIKKR